MDIAGIETSMDGFSRTHVRVEMVGFASTGILPIPIVVMTARWMSVMSRTRLMDRLRRMWDSC
jgi:hypothetical protein